MGNLSLRLKTNQMTGKMLWDVDNFHLKTLDSSKFHCMRPVQPKSFLLLRHVCSLLYDWFIIIILLIRLHFHNSVNILLRMISDLRPEIDNSGSARIDANPTVKFSRAFFFFLMLLARIPCSGAIALIFCASSRREIKRYTHLTFFGIRPLLRVSFPERESLFESVPVEPARKVTSSFTAT